ncbi:GNAT family N-acetyltransferase [Kineococcus glutinatus]|uniref:GNAT family N-acetyltransferase n=1 Tax=Kineococcus glutinatus TaxID=1070872 RepID=A0ABP9HA44_9ACTN
MDGHLAAEPIRTRRLQLEPLQVEHASEAAVAVDDEALHTYIGGTPASVDELRARHQRQVVGHSEDSEQSWLNRMLRRLDTAQLIGTVQATVSCGTAGETTAEVAWVVATGHQGQGYAHEASLAMATWLRQRGVATPVTHVHPEHHASAGVAQAVGPRPTASVVDGEVRWTG